MENQNFRYDVAFSFLADDEGLAFRINALIHDRLETFIYSKKKEDPAGADEEETFNHVFGSEARIVFVLYRKGWGETPWTRIEETAIRHRALEEGYDFVIFIPLDKPPEVPIWLPKNRIWIGLDRWEIEGAAAVIEARVQEKGGTPKEETTEGLALRFKREIAAEEQRQAFLQSEKGVQAANKAVAELFSELRRVVENISDSESEVELSIAVDQRECAIYGGGFCVHFYWNLTYSHTLDFSGLYLELWDGHVAINGRDKMDTTLDKPKEIRELKFKLYLDMANKPVWREFMGKKHFYSTRDLAKLALTMLYDRITD